MGEDIAVDHEAVTGRDGVAVMLEWDCGGCCERTML